MKKYRESRSVQGRKRCAMAEAKGKDDSKQQEAKGEALSAKCGEQVAGAAR
jgi:hypothetical protein